jgi:soluble P-type ATPase
MIELDIPGYGCVTLRHLVCDFNGTLACNGQLLPGVRDLLQDVSRLVDVHVITADTFGGARDQLGVLPCSLCILPSGTQGIAKGDYVNRLGPEATVCVGNGRNDRLMLQQATIGIAVIQAEGASAVTLQSADVVCRTIHDALALLLDTRRLVATLRS